MLSDLCNKIKSIIFRFSFICLLLSLFNSSYTRSDIKENGSSTGLFQFCSSLKGFNLLGKFDQSWSNNGFTEEEFRLVNELGFNFARLPLDYRTYIIEGNWNEFNENEINEIDKALEWGEQYDVHICINLHRAPGYCVNKTTLPPDQDLDLWTNKTAQDVFIKHWEFFANRYKDIPPDNLSFNLVNEPSNVTEEVYVNLMKRAIEVIHEITPDRIVFVDALNYGRELILGLKDEPNIAQAIHCYDPFGVTHYKAEWVEGADMMQTPKWPVLQISKYLYGPWKSEYQSTLSFEGDFPEGTEIIVNVHQVSSESTLHIKADEQTILNKEFVCTADTGEDFSVVVENQWGFQNISNKDFSAITSSDATILSFENVSGDWMTLNSITLKTKDNSRTFLLGDDTWGSEQDNYLITSELDIKAIDGSDLLPFKFYRDNIKMAKENNIAFMVQEFGVYNKTPHDVTLAFLQDLVGLLETNEIGWALWNFIGSFGILNSGRDDCKYETYQGYELDRKMLNILTKEYTFTEKCLNHKPLTIYPSPTNNELFIYPLPVNDSGTLYINDITGKLMKTVHIESTRTFTTRVDITDLKPGIYYIILANRNSMQTSKFIVQ